MTSSRLAFGSKLAFLAANLLFSGMLCWEMSGRIRLFVMILPLAMALCLKWRGLLGHALAGFGAMLVFFGYQSYSVNAQLLHYLASCVAALLVLDSGPDRAPESYGPLRLWLLGLVGIMLAGLPLLPLGEFAQAGRELGLSGLARMAGYSVAASSIYALASLDRLLLFALLAWELSLCRDDKAIPAVLGGVAASIPAAMVLGLAEYFLAGGTAFAMSDRLTSVFLNPGWFAEYVCVGFPFLLLMGRRKGRWALYALLAVGLVAMVLTMARAAWLIWGFLSVALVAASFSRFDLYAFNWGRLTRGVLAGTACVAVLTGGVYWGLSASKVSLLNFPLATMISKRLERFSETPRPTVFKSGVLIGLESPVSGMGYETYAWHYPHLMDIPESSLAKGVSRQAEVFEATHNLYIQMFAGGGLLGLAAWVFMAFRAFQLSLRAHRLRADPLSLSVFLSLTAFHLFGLFQEMTYVPAVWLSFFVVLAWCLRQEDAVGGWVAPFTEHRAARAVSLAVLCALALNLSNAGYAGLAAGHGLKAYPRPGERDLQGLFGPEVIGGRPRMWSVGASSFVLSGQGPWTYTVGLPHPDLQAKSVRLVLSAGGAVLASANLGGEHARASATLTIPAGSARPGQRVFLSVSRVYFPLMTGANDHRALGAYVEGPGITPGGEE